MMFTPDQIKHLPTIISGPRFATYLKARNNDPKAALALYQWNLEISAAFIVPLQICEISVRNGIVEAIEKTHGPNWPWLNGFINSLPVPKKPSHYNPQRDLKAVAAQHPTTGKVIADLKFAFWEKLLTVGQDQRLWIPHFAASFPGALSAQVTIPLARDRAFNALLKIRRFRNRIAHHEPIFSRHLGNDYNLIREVISWRSQVAADWVDNIQNVKFLLATPK